MNSKTFCLLEIIRRLVIECVRLGFLGHLLGNESMSFLLFGEFLDAELHAFGVRGHRQVTFAS